MRKIKSKGTGPEKLLLDAIRRLGGRARRYVGTLPGKPDFVFHKERLACFVDGEYWHGVQWRRRRLNFLAEQFSDAAKKDAWLAKIHRNMERDIRNTSTLLGKGWTVLRFWTRDIRRNAEGVAAQDYECSGGKAKPSRVSHFASGTAADFFAGIGLMRLGLKKAGWRTVWANDFDPIKRALYLRNVDGEALTLDPRPVGEIRAP